MLKQTAVRRHTSLYPLLLAFALAFSGLTGCAKQRAGLYLKQAKKRHQEARAHEAERFRPTELKDVESKIAEVQQQLDQGAFEQALNLGAGAAEAAKRLLEYSRSDRATALKKEADQDVQVATTNRGQEENPQLFQQIVDANTKAGERFAKSKYERTIELCLQVKNGVVTLLLPRRERAEGELRKAGDMLQTLVREEGRTEAPTYVVDAETKIAEIKRLIEEERMYLKAGEVFQETAKLIETGILVAQGSRSNKVIKVLESKLARAVLEDAEIYNPDFLYQCQQQHSKIMKHFYAQEYVHVLQAADLLVPLLDQLIVETQILAAKAAIESVETAIRALEADKVREYLPGRLEQVDEMLAKAQDELSQDLYSDCKKTCKTALEEKDLILGEYDLLTANEIGAASGRLAEVNAILDRVGEIFQVQSPPSPDPTEQSFENAKATHKTRLTTIAQDAGIILATAGVQREDKQFSAAIENARLAVKKANYVVREVFHVVAHNNVLELSDRITKVKANGGEQFASDELDAATAVLEEARTMIREHEATDQADPDAATDPEAYQPAVKKTAEAKAAIESVVQRVTKTAVGKIAEADEAVKLARANKADVFALGDLATASQALEQARERLSESKLLETANRADEARQVALVANQKALRSWATRELDAAQEELKKAEAARANLYAGEEYKEGLNQTATARNMFEGATQIGDLVESSQAFEKSRDLAIGGRRAAVEARMEPITEANRAIVDAKRYDAWGYDYEALMHAIISAKIALDAMEAGDYENSKVYAEKAEKEAGRAVRRAKDAAHRDRVRDVGESLDRASKQGAIYFAVEDVRSLALRLQNAKEKYSPEQFDGISLELDRVENDLYNMVQSTPKVFNEMLSSQRGLYDDLVRRDAKTFAEEGLRQADQHLRFASIDFGKGSFRSAYRNLRQGAEALGKVDLNLQECAFVDETRGLFSELEEEKKQIQAILDIPPAMLRLLLTQSNAGKMTNAVIAGAEPVRFREAMDRLCEKSRMTPYPITMVRERDQLVKVFDLSRQSSCVFEKFLILEHYDTETAMELRDQGHALMAEAMAARMDLSKRFETKGLQGKIATLQQVIGKN